MPRKPEIGPLFAVGHSTLPIEKFLAILKGHGVTLLADVRTVPQSRFNPQFGQKALEKSLRGAGIRYAHLKGLGGLRKARKDSPNGAWKNASFRGYADYMQTPEFEEALEGLLALAKKETVAFMCSEGNPFRCHRSLLADALSAKGARVLHTASPMTAKPHARTPFARVRKGKVSYPAPAGGKP